MRLAGLTFKVGSAGKRARLAQSGRGQTRGQTAKSFLWIALTTPQTPQYADASGTLSLFKSWIRREPKAVPPARPSWSLPGSKVREHTQRTALSRRQGPVALKLEALLRSERRCIPERNLWRATVDKLYCRRVRLPSRA